MNIMTIGGATQDLCVSYQQQEIACLDTPTGKQRFLLLSEGAKIELERIAYLPGGGAHNAAVSYARQGFDARIACCVGADCQADFVIDNLKKNNVSTDFVSCIASMTTGFSFIITLNTGDRTVLVNRGANLALSAQHVPDAALSGIDQLYITSLTGSTAALLPIFTQQARRYNIPVAVNPGSSQLRADGHYLRQALSSIDILILNSYEATLFMESLTQAKDNRALLKPGSAKAETKLNTHAELSITAEPRAIQYRKGSNGEREVHAADGHMHTIPTLLDNKSCLDLRLFCSYVQHYGTKIVVVTNGAEGVYVAADNCLYFYPSKPVNVVSTLGAGDAFGSGFVGHLVRGGTVEQAIMYGMANCHAVIGDYGAQTGLLYADALAQAAQTFDLSLLQKHSLV